MKVLFLCKASVEIGLGHLIRTRTIAEEFHNNLKYSGAIKMIAIGPQRLLKPLLSDIDFFTQVISSENELDSVVNEEYNFIFFDMLEIKDEILKKLKQKARKTVTISPIFNNIKNVDMFFHRTKYHHLPANELPDKTYMGLDYAIIQKNCKRIDAGTYEKNLNNGTIPIAVSMGGGDAANKTLSILKEIKRCKSNLTIWVMLGEGYKYSYDELIAETQDNHQHEIILAKTNRSMWQVLQNCVLGIFTCGITTYEAAFAGLPIINIYDNQSQLFLIKELINNNVGIDGGIIDDHSNNKFVETIDNLSNNPKLLMNMHIQSKNIIPNNGSSKIFKVCLRECN